MEPVTRHRVLRFSSNGPDLKATNQRNCTFSTEQFIKQTHKVEFTVPLEEKNQEWYISHEDGNVTPYSLSDGTQSAHLPILRVGADILSDAGQNPTITVKNWALNETIQSFSKNNNFL